MRSILTPRQNVFVQEYLVDLNAKQAAIRAGYSAKTAEVQGSRLLSNAKVAKEVELALSKRSEKVGIDAEWVLKHTADILQADVGDIVCPDNTFKPIVEWPPIWRQLLAGIDIKETYIGTGENRQKTGQVVKIRFFDRLRALELAGRHVNIQAFNERKVIETSAELKLDRAVREIDQVIAEALGKEYIPEEALNRLSKPSQNAQ